MLSSPAKVHPRALFKYVSLTGFANVNLRFIVLLPGRRLTCKSTLFYDEYLHHSDLFAFKACQQRDDGS